MSASSSIFAPEMSINWKFCGCSGPTFGVPVDRPLVHGDQVLALRVHRVPLRRREVADVVVDGDLVDELERLVGRVVRLAERPFRDRALEIEARVGVALVVVLRVQRTRAELDLAGDDRVELQDGDAVAVLAFEVLRLDRFLDQVEAVDGRVRIELARDGDVVTLRARCRRRADCAARGEDAAGPRRWPSRG